MTRDDFEKRVLDVWVNTRVPLTHANIQYATGARRKQVVRWMDELVAEGFAEIGNDDEGELLYSVRGATRATRGTASVAELSTVRRIEADVRQAGTSLVRAARAADLVQTGPGKKSILASAGLSFVFGPLGWLYAAPLGEALPAMLAFFLLYKFLPMFLFAPLLGILLPVSAVAGAAYAWKHNKTGNRASLTDLLRDKKPPRV